MVTRDRRPPVPFYNIGALGPINSGEITVDGGLVHSLKKMEHQLIGLTQTMQQVNHPITDNPSFFPLRYAEVEIAGIHDGPIQASDNFLESTYLDMTTENGTDDEELLSGTIKTWIDAIRLEADVDAWVWSFGGDTGINLTGDVVAEFWEALGTIHEVSFISVALLDVAASTYSWDAFPHEGLGPNYLSDNLVSDARFLFSLDETTRRSGVYSFFLFQHSNEVLSLNTTTSGQWKIVYDVDVSTAENGYSSTPTGTVITGQTSPTIGGGAGFQHHYTDLIDLTDYHPTTGSGAFNYRVQYLATAPSTDAGQTNRRHIAIDLASNCWDFSAAPENETGRMGLWQPGKQ